MNPPGILNPFGGSWDSILMYLSLLAVVIGAIVMIVKGWRG